eukprot:m.58424 g.58424  ORF g.58424 m.58424 type:complete len:156 (-) comp13149_c0_seq1:536-1003(-)
MEMWFEQTTDAVILFKGWETHTKAQYIGACIGVVILGFIYEWAKNLRSDLDSWMACRLRKSHSCCKDEQQGLLGGAAVNGAVAATPVQIPFHYQLVRTLIHMLHFTLAYFLMLIAMTYNTGLFISLVAGSGLGYFVFMRRGLSSSGSNETSSSCH